MEENKENKEKKENIMYLAKQKSEEVIKTILDEGIRTDNIDLLYKIIDVHKDIENEEYWKIKEECIMYRDYGNYNGYNEGNGRGRYNEGYGRRGVPGSGRGRYRGEEMLDEMKYHYGAYQNSYNAGNYNAKEDSSYKMTEAFKEFVYAVGEELDPKDKQMFKQAMQEMVQKLN